MGDNKKLVPVLVGLIVVALVVLVWQISKGPGDNTSGSVAEEVGKELPKPKGPEVDAIPAENTMENTMGQGLGTPPKGGK